MRYLVLTDIHANLEALDACLQDAGARGFDRVLVLGDVIGYGPDPNAVCDRIQALRPAAIVRGNHDKVAIGLDQAEGFHAAARRAAQWTIEALTPENRTWVAELPKGPIVVDDLVAICHGTAFDEDTYVVDEIDAMRAIAASPRPVCFFGHTHYAIAFELSSTGLTSVAGDGTGLATATLNEASRYLINPGSVGQPRDGDARAAYAILDTDRRELGMYRVEYAVNVTQGKMLAAGLPEPLARRLSSGR